MNTITQVVCCFCQLIRVHCMQVLCERGMMCPCRRSRVANCLPRRWWFTGWYCVRQITVCGYCKFNCLFVLCGIILIASICLCIPNKRGSTYQLCHRVEWELTKRATQLVQQPHQCNQPLFSYCEVSLYVLVVVRIWWWLCHCGLQL